MATCSAASAGAVAATSASMSTFRVSNHSRALAAVRSALFWWSATISSIGLPSTLPPKSAIAMLAAITAPGPTMSA